MVTHPVHCSFLHHSFLHTLVFSSIISAFNIFQTTNSVLFYPIFSSMSHSAFSGRIILTFCLKKKKQFSGHIWHQKHFLNLNEAPHTNHLHKIYHMCIIPDVYYCTKHTEPVCSKSNNSSLIEAIFII